MLFVVAYPPTGSSSTTFSEELEHPEKISRKISRDKEDNQQQTQPMLGCSKENEKEKRKKTTATTKIHILLSSES